MARHRIKVEARLKSKSRRLPKRTRLYSNTPTHRPRYGVAEGAGVAEVSDFGAAEASGLAEAVGEGATEVAGDTDAPGEAAGLAATVGDGTGRVAAFCASLSRTPTRLSALWRAVSIVSKSVKTKNMMPR